MILTREKLIQILQKQPRGTKILIEDFNGATSQYMKESDVVESWNREGDNGEGTENVMMFTVYREK